MKTRATTSGSARTHRLTLGEARQAARAAKGSRPTGTFIVLGTGKAKALRERYLGEIVHVPAGSGSSAHAASTRRARGKIGVIGKFAKKK